MAQVRKRIAPPLVGSDIILVIRPGQNINQVLDCTYQELVNSLSTALASASGLVPETRTLTINGVTYDLTQDRSWTVGGGTGAVDSVNGQTGVVILALDDISNVNAPSPTNGQILQWNGTQWVSATVGAAAWGSIGAGTGVGSQADLVAYLAANYQVIGSYVLTTRTITINGLTQDLSANRTWNLTANNGVQQTTGTPTNFELGGSIIKNTLINVGPANSAHDLQFDSPGPLDGSGKIKFTATTGTYSPTDKLVRFEASGAISAYVIATGTNGTGIFIDSTSANAVPMIMRNSSAAEIFRMFNSGQLQLNLYNTSTAFSSGLTSIGILNVDNTGKVFVGAGGGGGGVTSVGATAPITSSGGTTPTISTSMATNKLIGRGTAGTGPMEEITLGTNLSLSGTTLNATGGGSSLNDTTGILFGGALSATIGGTTFSVTAGIGQIVTQTATIAGVVTTVSNVTWSAVSGAAITNIGTSQFTYVLVNSSGTVIQQTSPFTDAQYKTHIIIGILCHIDFASVNLVTNSQNVAYEDPHRLVELITSFGPIKKTGLNIGPNGANLRVNRTSGEAFKIGANYITDQFEPDVATISAATPALLCRVHRNGSGGFIFDVNGGSYYNDIDPNQYDNGSGTLQSVGGSKWTIQRLFFFPNNPADIICYYGTQVYNQFSEARANLEFETFDEAQITTENAVFLGFLFVRNAATNLSLTTQAAFLQSGLFRGIPPGGGGSGGGGNSIGELTSPGDVTTPAATAPSQGVTATLDSNYKKGSCGVVFDGQGGTISNGKVAYVQVPYKGEITAWFIAANAIGSCTITVRKGGFSPFPPSLIIVTPTLSGFQTSTATVSPVITVAAGEWISFTISGVLTVSWVNLTLSITKTL